MRRAIFDSGIAVRAVQHGRVDAMRALAALEQGAAPGAASLKLSRDALTFNVRAGRAPRTQTITLHTEGGGQLAELAQGRLGVRQPAKDERLAEGGSGELPDPGDAATLPTGFIGGGGQDRSHGAGHVGYTEHRKGSW